MSAPDPETLVRTLAAVYLRTVRLMDRRMAEQGASLARTKLLLFLQKHGPSRSATIADYFNQAPRTVTEAIDALERDGLVRRDPDPTDRRAKLVSVTDAGERAAATTEPLRQRLIGEVFGSLTPDDRERLARLLETLTAALDAQEPRPD